MLGLASLYDILHCRRLLPTFYARRNPQWTHHRALIRLPDAEQFDLVGPPIVGFAENVNGGVLEDPHLRLLKIVALFSASKTIAVR